MEPFLLKPSCKDSIWGGTKLKKRFHKEHSVDIISESWELSVHPGGLSLAASGPNRSVPLAELIKNPAVTGNFAASFTVFPLMIKWIDSQLPLSIQVHPDNDYAMAHEQDMGKTEMWYIIDCEPDSYLYYGFSKEISREEFAHRIADDTLLEVVRKVPVKKGDVLIAGYMQGKYTDTRYLHALGEVKATISYEKTKEFSYVEEEYYETGNKNKKYELSIGDKNFKLYKKLTKFEFYKTQKTENNLKFAKNFYLPIKITKLENYERIKETKKYSLEDSIKRATEQLEKEMQENIENKENIINKNVVTDPKENTVIVKLIYEVEENIGEDQRF